MVKQPCLLGIAWDVKLYFTITHSDKFIKNWADKTALSLESQEGILRFLEYGYETEAEQLKSHPGLALATAIIAKEVKETLTERQWLELQYLSGEKLVERIEGIPITKKDLNGIVICTSVEDKSYAEKTKEYFTRYINGLLEKKVADFKELLTSSRNRGLGEQIKVLVEKKEGIEEKKLPLPKISTCFGHITLPY